MTGRRAVPFARPGANPSPRTHYPRIRTIGTHTGPHTRAYTYRGTDHTGDRGLATYGLQGERATYPSPTHQGLTQGQAPHRLSPHPVRTHSTPARNDASQKREGTGLRAYPSVEATHPGHMTPVPECPEFLSKSRRSTAQSSSARVRTRGQAHRQDAQTRRSEGVRPPPRTPRYPVPRPSPGRQPGGLQIRGPIPQGINPQVRGLLRGPLRDPEVRSGRSRRVPVHRGEGVCV